MDTLDQYLARLLVSEATRDAWQHSSPHVPIETRDEILKKIEGAAAIEELQQICDEILEQLNNADTQNQRN